MPKFSVIIPVYNAEKYLKKCVSSLLNQNYADFEVILVDDGSSDGCSEICDHYAQKDTRVKVIHKKNAGVSLARQDGIAIASGEYLLFVDADDQVTEDYFSIVSKHTDVDVVRFGCYAEQPDGTRLQQLPLEREGKLLKQDIERGIFPYLIQNERGAYYCPSLWRHAFKRSLFVANMPMDKVIRIGEDGACVMPCIYRAESMYCVHKCIYIYSYNEDSATKGRKVYSWEDPLLIAEHLQEKIDIKSFDFQEQLYRHMAHGLFLVAVSQFNRSDSYRTIVKDIDYHLKLKAYAECIRKAKFKSLKGKLAVFAMRYRLSVLMKLYNKLKR